MSNPLDPRTRTAGLVAAALGTLALAVASLAPAVAHAADDVPAPALDALRQVRGDTPAKNVIQNKFFLKTERFEIAPALGTMPNNSFVLNPYGGAVLAYHFSETLAAEGTFLYAPNTGVAGVKGLTKTLVAIAHDTGTQELQQPLDRLQLGALFAARWAPVYGKINLLGEGVANFDLYGTAGAGLLLITKDTAVYNTDFERDPAQSIVLVNPEAPTKAHVAVNLGVGMDFYLSQSMALKLDARGAFYMAPEPDYGNANETLENRLYTPFLTTAGVSFFFPKMKPRATF